MATTREDLDMMEPYLVQVSPTQNYFRQRHDENFARIGTS